MVGNDIRHIALGKKNWFFIGRPEAGRRTAIRCSVIVSSLRHVHDPKADIPDLLTRLPTMNCKDNPPKADKPRRPHALALEGARADRPDHADGGLGYDGLAVVAVTKLVTTGRAGFHSIGPQRLRSGGRKQTA